MKISLNEIVSNVENLKELQKIKLPVKTSYRLMRLVNKLDPILKGYDEKRNELIKKFGDEQEDGSVAVKDVEKQKLFFAELADLLKIEEEIEFELLKIEDLGDVNVEARLLINWLFE